MSQSASEARANRVAQLLRPPTADPTETNASITEDLLFLSRAAYVAFDKRVRPRAACHRDAGRGRAGQECRATGYIRIARELLSKITIDGWPLGSSVRDCYIQARQTTKDTNILYCIALDILNYKLNDGFIIKRAELQSVIERTDATLSALGRKMKPHSPSPTPCEYPTACAICWK